MGKKKRIFVINGEEREGVITGKTEEFYIIEFAVGEYNYIKPDGTLLSPNENFITALDFKEGLAIVEKKENRYNFIKTDGTFLSPEDFCYVEEFNDGFAVVEKEGDLWNYIRPDGTFLIPNRDFEKAYSFDGGLAYVTVTCLIDEDGNLIFY